MRLIYADDAINIFTNRLFEMLKTQIPVVPAEENQVCLDTCYKIAKYEIDNIPTAFDIEKTTKQLEEMFNVDPIYYGKEAAWAVDKAIEIVKNAIQ